MFFTVLCILLACLVVLLAFGIMVPVYGLLGLVASHEEKLKKEAQDRGGGFGPCRLCTAPSTLAGSG